MTTFFLISYAPLFTLSYIYSKRKLVNLISCCNNDVDFKWFFSGLRGAIAFALSLHMEFSAEKRYILVTTTLIIVLFTIMGLGGATMPMMKVRIFFLFLQITKSTFLLSNVLDFEILLKNK